MSVYVALASAVLAAAQAATPAAPSLSLDELIAEAVARNPGIAAARERHAAARERPVQEHSLPDPMVSAGYASSGSPLPGAGLGTEPTANIGVAVSQEIPYPGKRDLRSAVAARDADVVAQDVEAARLAVIARVKQAYFRLAYTYAATDVLARNQQLLDTLLRVSEGRYSVGRAAQQDVFKAQTELSILELRQERLRQERATREGEINALVGRAPGSPLGRPDPLDLPPFTVALADLIAHAPEHAPPALRDAAMVARSRAAVDVARSEYHPDFALSGGYAFMGSMPSMYEMRFDVRIPLQRARRAAAVAEQQATVAAAERSQDATRLSIQAQLVEAFQAASTSSRLALLYRDTVLPQSRLALESSLASYETGTVEFLSVLTNFGTVLDYEMNYFDELASFHTAMSRLEEIAGMAIAH